ncbi:MAG: hypothetical protein QNJ38_06185 [Prochloraceae cyanobacterium]|nr:hypothetical protein [Prochloraceae cyanobacterium]
MLTEQEQKMITDALNKISLDIQEVIKNQERIETKIDAVDQKLDFKVENLETKIDALDKKLDYKVETLEAKIDAAKQETKALGEKLEV